MSLTRIRTRAAVKSVSCDNGKIRSEFELVSVIVLRSLETLPVILMGVRIGGNVTSASITPSDVIVYVNSM